MVSRRLSVGLLLALLAACTPVASPTAPASSLPAVETVPSRYVLEAARHVGGTVTVGLFKFPTALSPVVGGQAAAVPIEQALFNGLTAIDPSLNWYGDLAREAPTLENGGVKLAGRGMEVHFVLRAGLSWSDGQPISADDVNWTWQAIMGSAELGGASREGYDQITAIEREGSSGLVMRYGSVYPAYLGLFGTILPRHRLASIEPARLAADS